MNLLQSLDSMEVYTDMTDACCLLDIGDRIAKDIISLAVDAAMFENDNDSEAQE